MPGWSRRLLPHILKILVRLEIVRERVLGAIRVGDKPAVLALRLLCYRGAAVAELAGAGRAGLTRLCLPGQW